MLQQTKTEATHGTVEPGESSDVKTARVPAEDLTPLRETLSDPEWHALESSIGYRGEDHKGIPNSGFTITAGGKPIAASGERAAPQGSLPVIVLRMRELLALPETSSSESSWRD